MECLNFNPFDNNQTEKSNDLLKENIDVEIWVENRGRKSDTYISGLSYDDETLKDHFKNIKKKIGSNGSIKIIERDSVNIKVLHIQGNQKTFLYDFFTKCGLENIKLKG